MFHLFSEFSQFDCILLIFFIFALRILIQSLTVLTNPPEWLIKEIQDNFYNFLWNGKNDKIEGTVMIND
jgi:hypothetical protein